MIIDLNNETTYLDDGTYTATIQNVFDFLKGDDPCICIEFAIEDEDNTVFTKFYDDPAKWLGSYPWSSLFRAIGSRDTNDLIGLHVEFEVKTNTKNDLSFSNIKKIKLVD